MEELLKNAWLGWQNYIDNGKLAALLFAALLFLWLSGKMWRQKALFGYTAIMTVCCVFPVTAAVLMLYQTKFYDYEWIWSLCPFTAVTAWGITEFLSDERLRKGIDQEKAGPKAGKASKQKNGGQKAVGQSPGRIRFRLLGYTAMTAAVILLCGNLGGGSWQPGEEKETRDRAEEAVTALTENGQAKDICLLAPQEVMEYARSFDGSIRLPYGRNMWDKSLDGYSYDTYTQEIQDLYEWMCTLEELGSFDEAVAAGMAVEEQYSALVEDWSEKAAECAAVIQEKGVNTLLLPQGLRPDMLAEMESLFQVQASSLEGYYLLSLQ